MYIIVAVINIILTLTEHFTNTAVIVLYQVEVLSVCGERVQEGPGKKIKRAIAAGAKSQVLQRGLPQASVKRRSEHVTPYESKQIATSLGMRYTGAYRSGITSVRSLVNQTINQLKSIN